MELYKVYASISGISNILEGLHPTVSDGCPSTSSLTYFLLSLIPIIIITFLTATHVLQFLVP